MNENSTPKNIAQLAAELMEKNVWPIEGTEVLGFYVTTEMPIWGITIFKAENVEQVLKDVAVWSNAKPSFFKIRRVTSVMAAEEAIPVVMEMQIQNQKSFHLPSFLSTENFRASYLYSQYAAESFAPLLIRESYAHQTQKKIWVSVFGPGYLLLSSR